MSGMFSGLPAARSLLMYVTTAVFRPDRLKRMSPECIIARGNAMAFGLPFAPCADTTGPPG